MITDGCSNVGIDPVIAAAHAQAEDIIVNVIGVKRITGHSQMEKLAPEQRSQVVRMMDDWIEKTNLHIVLLVDTSASMKSKLYAVEEVIRN